MTSSIAQTEASLVVSLASAVAQTPMLAPPESRTELPVLPPRDGTSRRHHMTQNTPEWDAWRALCDLTASDAPALCGSGIGYKTATELYVEKKTGKAPSMSIFVQEAAARGHLLEPRALAWLDSQTGKKHRSGSFHTRWVELHWREVVKRDDGLGTESNKKHSKWVLLGASPDATYEDADGTTVIEVKCPLSSTQCSPHSANENYRKKFWRYWIQVQFQLWVMDKRDAILCVWHPELPPNVFRVWFLADWWEKYFIPRLTRHIAGLHASTPPKRQPPGHLLELYAWASRLDETGAAPESVPALVPAAGSDSDDSDDAPLLESASRIDRKRKQIQE